MEAMAAGLPVVSTTVSGIGELVEHDRTGLLVPPEDPAALADAILRLAKDPALARRLARAGSGAVRRSFDGDAMARQLAALFAGGRP
jgi:glycosyltransferase involved in cell wall biosynthesis